MVRPREARIVAGVCSGLAEHLNLPVVPVRIGMAVLGLIGPGVVAYLMLWGLTPQEEAIESRLVPLDPSVGVSAGPTGPGVGTAASPGADLGANPGADPGADPGAGQASEARRRRRRRRRAARRARSVTAVPSTPRDTRSLLLAGLLLAVVGIAWLAQNAGLDVRLGFLVPVVAIALGAVIGLSQLDASRRDRWLGRPGSSWRAGARLALGIAVTAVGAIVLVSRGSGLRQMADVGLATLVVLLGTALVAAPWAYRVWTDLRTEQAARARADERADIAAHLHDSVLQTLAMIQRQSTDSGRVATLARAQERELRSWLYGGGADPQTSLADAVAAVIDDIEAAHGIPIDLVSTGNRRMDDAAQALVRALREALTNAANHGAPPISVYLEATDSGVEAFVRDHGQGIDLDSIPDDRLGVRESIIGRMHRHGGSASVRRLDPGTEWCLTLPAPALEGAST